MSKDPAVLFYTSDFLTGTSRFSDEQCGQYIRALCSQHQEGMFTKEELFQILKSYDSPVWKKFIQDSNGLFYNKRMMEEIERRVTFCNSRSHKGSSGRKKKSSDNHMITDRLSIGNLVENENENENKDVIEDKNRIEFDVFRKKYPGSKRGNDTEYENFCKKHKDWRTVLPLLLTAVTNQSAWRVEMSSAGMFVPEWKNLQTWINQRCWEMEKPVIEKKNDFGNKLQPSQNQFGRKELTRDEFIDQMSFLKDDPRP